MTEQQSQTDAAPMADEVTVELVKGPGPEWTSENSYLEHPNPEGIAQHGLAIDEIRDEGTEDELKGPGPEWAHLYEEG